jgi:hypothetical protein
MKQCPKCNRTYDDSQAFCLMDGTALTVEGEVETVIRRQSPPPKKNISLLWLVVASLTISLIAFAVAGFLIYKFAGSGENARANRQNVVNISTSPAPTAVAKPIAAGSPAGTSPLQINKPSATDEDAEDITPIAGTQRLTVLRLMQIKFINFAVPKKA